MGGSILLITRLTIIGVYKIIQKIENLGLKDEPYLIINKPIHKLNYYVNICYYLINGHYIFKTSTRSPRFKCYK